MNTTQTSTTGTKSELQDALDAKAKLMDRIRAAGTPPHSDFWCQSIAEADERIRKAGGQA